MRLFETADVAPIDMLKARYETMKAQLADEAKDAQRAAAIAAELREMADKASAELLRIADRFTAIAGERSRSWWQRLAG
jgi:hypothetical protein